MGTALVEGPVIQTRGGAPLAGRTAVVMGAPREPGGVLAETLSARGANVVMGESVASRGRGRRPAALQTVLRTIDRRLETAHARVGHIDALVTASTFPSGGDHTPDRPQSLFESQVPLHLVDTWCVAHAAARLMARDKRGGEILIRLSVRRRDESPRVARSRGHVGPRSGAVLPAERRTGERAGAGSGCSVRSPRGIARLPRVRGRGPREWRHNCGERGRERRSRPGVTQSAARKAGARLSALFHHGGVVRGRAQVAAE